MKWIGLVVAVSLAAIAAFMVLRATSKTEDAPVVAQNDSPVVVSTPQAPADVETVDVYVAADEIPIGTTLQEGLLDPQPWPAHLVVEGFVVGPEEAKNTIGTVTRAAFKKREPLMKSKLVNPGDPNFIAGSLPEGKRVVTIRTDDLTSVGGFVFPGDRVDVLITHKILREGITAKDLKEKGEGDLSENVTETLLTNIRVLATDQKASVNNEEGIKPANSVSLEVDPVDAQRLRLAEETGKLSLSLRSIKDKDNFDAVSLTRIATLSQYKPDFGQPAESTSATLSAGEYIPVTIVRGTEVDDPDGKKKRLDDVVNRRGGAAPLVAQK